MRGLVGGQQVALHHDLRERMVTGDLHLIGRRARHPIPCQIGLSGRVDIGQRRGSGRIGQAAHRDLIARPAHGVGRHHISGGISPATGESSIGSLAEPG